MTSTVLITGCSSGIGAATVRHFAAQGWNVAATLRDPAAAHFEDSAGKVASFALDVTDPQSVDAAVAQAVERFGHIDVLINNAGYGLFGPFESATQEVIERQFQTNVFGVFDVTRAAAHARARQRRHHQRGVAHGPGGDAAVLAVCGVQVRGGGFFRITQPRIGAPGHPREGVCTRCGGD